MISYRWGGVGWNNNVHAPVHTQAQQPHHLFLLSCWLRHCTFIVLSRWVGVKWFGHRASFYTQPLFTERNVFFAFDPDISAIRFATVTCAHKHHFQDFQCSILIQQWSHASQQASRAARFAMEGGHTWTSWCAFGGWLIFQRSAGGGWSGSCIQHF